MKHILILLALVFSMAGVTAQTTSATADPTSLEQDYQTGVDYYNKGDFTQAYDEFEKLALQGYAKAQFAIGLMYERGQSVDRNLTQAFMWYILADRQGNKFAMQGRDAILTMLSPDSLVEANIRAQSCLDSKYQDCIVNTDLQKFNLQKLFY